jgi:hypothetical protein
VNSLSDLDAEQGRTMEGSAEDGTGAVETATGQKAPAVPEFHAILNYPPPKPDRIPSINNIFHIQGIVFLLFEE